MIPEEHLFPFRSEALAPRHVHVGLEVGLVAVPEDCVLQMLEGLVGILRGPQELVGKLREVWRRHTYANLSSNSG